MSSALGRMVENRTDRQGTPSAHRRGLDEEIADAIRARILSGEVVPGAHLVEASFVRTLGVSHGTVRAAFRLLAQEGIVEHQPRRGMFAVSFTAADVLEICSLRDSLEALAASAAARVASGEEKATVSKIMSRMAAAAKHGDRRACMALDLEFHRRIVAISHHRRLDTLYRSIETQVRLFMALTGPLHEDLSGLVAIHRPIADAILAGDGETAARLSASHNRRDGEALAARLPRA